MQKRIPIFFTFDNNYVIPAAVAFYSLLNKADKNVFYEMYVLHSDITQANQELLQNIVKRFDSAELIFQNTGDFLLAEWNNGNFEGHNNNSNKFTVETAVKCFAARFFPQHDKIIYSDVDCVFVDDISELYDIDLDGKYLAAVKNPFLKISKSELSHLKPEHYEKLKDTSFAGGIWVLNLKQIRLDNLENKMLDIIQDNSIVKRWPDQDIMNIACDNNIKYIPLNYISYPYMQEKIIDKNLPSHYSKEELYASVINPKIIHFAAVKPWKGCTNHGELWWSIHDYLELPVMFEPYDILKDKTKRKYKTYKLLFMICLIGAITTFIATICTFLIMR